jgi:hypothetical protein
LHPNRRRHACTIFGTPSPASASCAGTGGIDVHQRIAALSTYLGHAKVSDTYWYLTGVPELMAITASCFERFAHETTP